MADKMNLTPFAKSKGGYVNDDPPKLCACGQPLRGQMSIKTGECGMCKRVRLEAGG